MNNRQVKRLRKKMKLKLSIRDGYKADYRVAKEKKKTVYFDGYDLLPNGKRIKNGKKVAVLSTRRMIINATKLPYRRVKKEFKKMLKKGVHNVQTK